MTWAEVVPIKVCIVQLRLMHLHRGPSPRSGNIFHLTQLLALSSTCSFDQTPKSRHLKDWEKVWNQHVIKMVLHWSMATTLTGVFFQLKTRPISSRWHPASKPSLEQKVGHNTHPPGTSLSPGRTVAKPFAGCRLRVGATHFCAAWTHEWLPIQPQWKQHTAGNCLFR